MLPTRVRESIEECEDFFSQYSDFTFTVCLAYGGGGDCPCGEVGCYRLCLRESRYQFYKFIRDNKENVPCKVT